LQIAIYEKIQASTGNKNKTIIIIKSEIPVEIDIKNQISEKKSPIIPKTIEATPKPLPGMCL